MYRNECRLIEKLKLLLTVRDGLLDRVAQKRPLLKNEEITQIFARIQRQLRFHEKIYEKLVKIIENWDGSVCDVIRVWTETFDEHRQVYSSYANYYDSAKAMLENACEKDPKLEKFFADYEKNKLFGRKRVVEIMFEPVQYVPGLKNILERLEKVDREHGSNSPIGEAIVTIEKILSYSNSVRFNNDEGMKKLILTKEIEDLPADLLKASNSIHGLLEVRWICAEKKLNVGKDDTVKLILFSDSTVLNDRSLHFNTQMKVNDVPHVCGRVLKNELKKGRFEPTKDDDQKKAEEPQE
uniref:DH domain-containing protein n=1 Tax=Angiostrongylus cantonensis TaxID=6313 RepID=A0A158PCQ3_ANGCA